jgi:hypothetical protein
MLKPQICPGSGEDEKRICEKGIAVLRQSKPVS